MLAPRSTGCWPPALASRHRHLGADLPVRIIGITHPADVDGNHSAPLGPTIGTETRVVCVCSVSPLGQQLMHTS